MAKFSRLNLSILRNDTNEVAYNSTFRSLSAVPAWMIVHIISMSCLNLFGIAVNILSWKIFSNQIMKKSCLNWYLSVLSLSDGLFLTASFFSFISDNIYLFHTWNNTLLASVFNVIFAIFYPLLWIAQMNSIWLMIVMSTYRFVGVCFPFYVKRYNTKAKRYISVGFILIFSVAFNIPRFFEYQLVSNEYGIHKIVAQLKLSYSYSRIYIRWCYTFFMFITPFAMLIIMNAVITVIMWKSLKLHKTSKGRIKIRNRKVSSNSGQSKSGRRGTVLLIGIVVEFLIFNSLDFVASVVELIFENNEIHCDAKVYSLQILCDRKYFLRFLSEKFFIASYVLITLSAALNNLLVYLLFDKNYRLLFKRYFVGVKQEPPSLNVDS